MKEIKVVDILLMVYACKILYICIYMYCNDIYTDTGSCWPDKSGNCVYT